MFLVDKLIRLFDGKFDSYRILHMSRSLMATYNINRQTCQTDALINVLMHD